jgi:hypothetical protein
MTERTIRYAVARWTRARLRWIEFTMAEVGSEEYRRLFPEIAQRKKDLGHAETALLRLGTGLLLEERWSWEGKRE